MTAVLVLFPAMVLAQQAEAPPADQQGPRVEERYQLRRLLNVYGSWTQSLRVPAVLTLTSPTATNPNVNGFATTDAAGRAGFCYSGPSLPGSDVITAYADTDADDVRDPGEPAGTATNTWTASTSTGTCTVSSAATSSPAAALAPHSGEWRNRRTVSPVATSPMSIMARRR